ncbi:response regulator transcription factor [Bradyrhizobium symbiodeficiens]|uniref:response regulator transcription factor n=1 Tax=Bradyrhizobium symbiodeficiens TaxID=1404367 RepID=UPI0030CE0B47
MSPSSPGSMTASGHLVTPTYIIQGDNLFREGLRLLLSDTCFRPHGCATELEHLIEVPRDRTTLFIVGANQVVVCNKIRDHFPLAFIVAIADESNPSVLSAALENGANAALFNSVSPSALINSLRALIDGKLSLADARLCSRKMQPRFGDTALPPLQHDAPWEVTSDLFRPRQLSSRELEILDRIVQGESNKHIARFFSITEPTVKVHVKNIFRKIGANNRTQAAMWALNSKQIGRMNTAPRELSSLQQH